MSKKTPNINQILKSEPRNCKYGAPLGDDNFVDDLEDPMYVQRVKLIDGDYAPDGTYWGSGEPIYCAFTCDKTINRIYARAVDRETAIAYILGYYPDAKFIKGTKK